MFRTFFDVLKSRNSRGNRKARPADSGRRLRLEHLETRLVPATTASLVNGVLTITGDNTAQTYTISETDATKGDYTLTSNDNITQTGGTGGGANPAVFTGVTSILVNTGTGADNVTFTGFPGETAATDVTNLT